MSENPGPMSLPRSVRLPIKIPVVAKNEYSDTSLLSPSRYQCEVNSDMFDPYSSSPPQKFMLKLKERLNAYDSYVHVQHTSS
jgi:hypothetical protein